MNDRQEMFHTMNLMVATVLITYGFPLMTYTHVLRGDGKESKEFWFDAKSPECDVPTTPLDRDRKHWTQADYVAHYATKGADELKAINADHPILYMRAMMMNRNELLDVIKKAPRMVEISNGSRRALIAENASAETKRKIAAML